jgi:hypothetical protein
VVVVDVTISRGIVVVVVVVGVTMTAGVVDVVVDVVGVAKRGVDASEPVAVNVSIPTAVTTARLNSRRIMHPTMTAAPP